MKASDQYTARGNRKEETKKKECYINGIED